MSFDPLKFIFTIPKTVTPDPVAAAAAVAPVSGAVIANSTQAGILINQLKDLIATSQYLQQVILDRSQLRGVEIDPQLDPDVSRSLTQIYATDSPPGVITTGMYNHILDADLGVAQLEMATRGTPFEPNPISAANYSLVSRRVEQHLIQTGDFENAVVGLLRSLKADALIFQSWSEDLADYPVVRAVGQTPNPQAAIQAAGIDVSPDLNAYLNDHLDRYALAYTGTYNLLAGLSPVESDINKVVQEFSAQPLGDLVRVKSLLTSLTSQAHIERLQDLGDDLSSFSFMRLSSELGGNLFSLDRLSQMVSTPFSKSTSSLAKLVQGVQTLGTTVGRLPDGGLKGMLKFNSSASRTRTPDPVKQKQVDDSASSGLRSLGQHLDWALRESTRKQDTVNRQFKRLSERRINHTADSLELLSSLQQVNQLLSITQGFITQLARGSMVNSTPGTITSDQRPEILGNILDNLKTGKGATFSISGGEILVSPPNVRTPTVETRRVLERGGMHDLRQPFQGALSNA